MSEGAGVRRPIRRSESSERVFGELLVANLFQESARIALGTFSGALGHRGGSAQWALRSVVFIDVVFIGCPEDPVGNIRWASCGFGDQSPPAQSGHSRRFLPPHLYVGPISVRRSFLHPSWGQSGVEGGSQHGAYEGYPAQ
jgi:hypothetical protein